jgi:hypothetical protein
MKRKCGETQETFLRYVAVDFKMILPAAIDRKEIKEMREMFWASMFPSFPCKAPQGNTRMLLQVRQNLDP